MAKLRRQIFSKEYAKPFDSERSGHMKKRDAYKSSCDFSPRKKMRSTSLKQKICKKDNLGRRNYLERFCLYSSKPLLRLNKDTLHPHSRVERVEEESNDWPNCFNHLGKEHMKPKSERKVFVNDEKKFQNCDPFGNPKDRFKK
jgi:hypothetical protein